MGRLAIFFNQLISRFLPDAYVFAILLTFVTIFMSLVFTDFTSKQIALSWGNGFWNLNKFAMEMVLILVSGFTLAKTKLISGIIDKIASISQGQVKPVLLATLVSSLACFFNWGFGLVVAALISLEIAKRNKHLYPGLLIAASYSGFLLWHGGLSGSIPLKLTNPSSDMIKILGVDKIEIGETIFSGLNIILLLTCFLSIILINFLLSKNSKLYESKSVNFEQEEFREVPGQSFAEKMESSKFLTYSVFFLALAYFIYYLISGGGLNLNSLSFFFLFLGIALHGSASRFLFYFKQGVAQSSGIILQFPFYAGIMAIMKDSGLAVDLSQLFVSISNEHTFLLFSYWSAGLLNFFVPSGGGQWALQAPILLPAAKELGISLPNTAMAIAWGDAWTNMVQPFWAIPLISIVGLKLKDMMTYSVIIFFGVGVVSSIVFLIISL